MVPHDKHLLESQLRLSLGNQGALEILRPVSGGDINRAVMARLGSEDCFIKLNRADREDMFAAEFRSLERMAASQTIKVPRPICHGAGEKESWLVLEFIPLQSSGNAADLGRGLAALHAVTGERYGWPEDNFIGSNPQPNGTKADWPTFWWEQRLGSQLQRAADAGYGPDLSVATRELERALPALLSNHHPAPSLLHGDLWGGNHAYLEDGTPVIFDPASYFGDRETDLAMTELFGGFDPSFRAAYEEAWPLSDGYPIRRDLYQLYHLLNHLNLFGSGWLPRCLSVMDRLTHMAH